MKYLDDRGPFVLIAEKQVQNWYGVFNEDENETDYDRAWEAEDNVDTIEVRGQKIVVFAGFPTTIGAGETDAGTPFLFRVLNGDVFAEPSFNVLAQQSFNVLTDSVWQNTKVEVELDGNYLLFSASSSGSDIEAFIPVSFPAGRYLIQEHFATPNEDTRLRLHRFSPA